MVISLFNAERLGYGRPFSVTFGGKTHKGTLYEDCRITEVYKKSLHVYGMRHPDDAWDEPASIAPGYPFVNFFGTFVTKKPLPITEETNLDGWDELTDY